MNKRDKFIYFAGIIDGEGCIAVEKKFPSKRKKYPNYFARLIIVNTNLDLIEWISSNFKGKHYAKNGAKPNLQTCYAWYVFGKDLDEILKGILEFSIVKKRQILNVLEFRKTVGKTGQHVSQEMRDIRDKLHLKSRYFNSLHKNPSALSPVS